MTSIKIENADAIMKKRNRVPISCIICRRRKVKCDKQRPVCTGCSKNGVSHLCHYVDPPWAKPADETATTELDDRDVMVEAMAEKIKQLEEQLRAKSSKHLDASPSFGSDPKPPSTNKPESSSPTTASAAQTLDRSLHREPLNLFANLNTLTIQQDKFTKIGLTSPHAFIRLDPYLKKLYFKINNFKRIYNFYKLHKLNMARKELLLHQQTMLNPFKMKDVDFEKIYEKYDYSYQENEIDFTNFDFTQPKVKLEDQDVVMEAKLAQPVVMLPSSKRQVEPKLCPIDHSQFGAKGPRGMVNSPRVDTPHRNSPAPVHVPAGSPTCSPMDGPAFPTPAGGLTGSTCPFSRQGSRSRSNCPARQSPGPPAQSPEGLVNAQTGNRTPGHGLSPGSMLGVAPSAISRQNQAIRRCPIDQLFPFDVVASLGSINLNFGGAVFPREDPKLPAPHPNPMMSATDYNTGLGDILGNIYPGNGERPMARPPFKRQKINTVPETGSGFQHLSLPEILRIVERNLPKKRIIWFLVEKFFSVYYLHFPFLDEVDFKADISRIIGEADDMEQEVHISISHQTKPDVEAIAARGPTFESRFGPGVSDSILGGDTMGVLQQHHSVLKLCHLLLILRITWLGLPINLPDYPKMSMYLAGMNINGGEADTELMRPENIVPMIFIDIVKFFVLLYVQQQPFYSVTTGDAANVNVDVVSSLEFLQCGLLLKNYFMVSPENHDDDTYESLTITENEHLFSILVSVAQKIGLYRDPLTFILRGANLETNTNGLTFRRRHLWRKVWWTIWKMDVTQALMLGSPLLLNNEQWYDTELPSNDEGNETNMILIHFHNSNRERSHEEQRTDVYYQKEMVVVSDFQRAIVIFKLLRQGVSSLYSVREFSPNKETLDNLHDRLALILRGEDATVLMLPISTLFSEGNNASVHERVTQLKLHATVKSFLYILSYIMFIHYEQKASELVRTSGAEEVAAVHRCKQKYNEYFREYSQRCLVYSVDNYKLFLDFIDKKFEWFPYDLVSGAELVVLRTLMNVSSRSIQFMISLILRNKTNKEMLVKNGERADPGEDLYDKLLSYMQVYLEKMGGLKKHSFMAWRVAKSVGFFVNILNSFENLTSVLNFQMDSFVKLEGKKCVARHQFSGFTDEASGEGPLLTMPDERLARLQTLGMDTPSPSHPRYAAPLDVMSENIHETPYGAFRLPTQPHSPFPHPEEYPPHMIPHLSESMVTTPQSVGLGDLNAADFDNLFTEIDLQFDAQFQAIDDLKLFEAPHNHKLEWGV